MGNISQSKNSLWLNEWPTEAGWYWFYGWPYEGDCDEGRKSELNSVHVIEVSNGIVVIRDGTLWYRSEWGKGGRFIKAKIPSLESHKYSSDDDEMEASRSEREVPSMACIEVERLNHILDRCTRDDIDHGIMKDGQESRIIAVGPDVNNLWAAYGMLVSEGWDDERIVKEGIKLYRNQAMSIFPFMNHDSYRR